VTDAGSHITLFNDARYQRCNLRPGQRVVRYDHVMDGRLIGTLAGVLDDGVLDCGHSAPFGGVDFVRQGEAVGAIVEFLRAALRRAHADEIPEIRFRTRPAYFGSNDATVQFALANLGASIESCELSLGLELLRYPTPENYTAALRSSAAHKLRQGLRAGMAFIPAGTDAEWEECFDLLAETRHRRGARLKISFEYLMGLREIFGERVAMHRLRKDGELAGAALLYRVARDWDYLVAWGDHLRYRKERVINLMAYHLTCASIAQRVAIVDLGISSVNGIPDDGLIQFKRSIGATTGLRIDFRLRTA
jgi:hypothetical protein